jgi:hypothetical protein
MKDYQSWSMAMSRSIAPQFPMYRDLAVSMPNAFPTFRNATGSSRSTWSELAIVSIHKLDDEYHPVAPFRQPFSTYTPDAPPVHHLISHSSKLKFA